MSRIGRAVISSDDVSTPATLPASPAILPPAQGGTGVDTSGSSGIPRLSAGTWIIDPGTVLIDPTTAQGDLIARGAAALDRLPASAVDGEVLLIDTTESLKMKWGAVLPTPLGTDGQILTVDSGETLGIAWADAPVVPPGDLLVSTAGDLLTHNATVPAKFPIGTTRQALQVDTTVATKLRWADKVFLNVVDFGADPTGAVESTTAIQAAITATPATGGTVFIPKGTYRITTPGIALKSNLHLCGEGVGTVLNGFGPGAFSILTATGTALVPLSYCNIENMTLKGGASGFWSQYWVLGVMRDCLVSGNTYGVLADRAWGSAFYNVQIRNNVQQGAYLTYSNGVCLNHLTCIDNGASGLQIVNTLYFDAVALDIENNQAYGIYLQGVVGGRASGYIENNCLGLGGGGKFQILLADGATQTSGVVFDGCFVFGMSTSEYGIYFADSTRSCEVRGGHFEGHTIQSVVASATAKNIQIGAIDFLSDTARGIIPSVAGVATAANGGFITHGLGAEPVWITCTPTVVAEMVSVVAKTSTTFQVSIAKYDGSSGTTQPIYWQVGY